MTLNLVCSTDDLSTGKAQFFKFQHLMSIFQFNVHWYICVTAITSLPQYFGPDALFKFFCLK